MKCYTCYGKGYHGKTKEVANEIKALFGTLKIPPKGVIICKVCKGRGVV